MATIPSLVATIQRSSFNRLISVSVAGLLLGLCFPPYYLWPLMLPAFLIFYWSLQETGGWPAFRLGFLFAAIFYLLHTYWFASFHPLALPFMLIWLGLIHGLYTWGVTRYEWNPLTAACGWLITQWFIGVGYHGFPWSRLATALATVPETIQPVRYLGELGWGALIVLFCFSLAESLYRWEYVWLTLGLVVCLGLGVGEGYVRYNFDQVTRTGRRVMLVQPNVASGDMSNDPAAQLRRVNRLTKKHAEPGDLVVWPETVVIREPFSIDGDSLRWRSARWRGFFTNLLDPGYSLFFGVRFTDPKPGHLPRLNGGVMLDSSAHPVSFYTKRRPVPGGEHLPLMGSVSLVRKLGRALGTLGYRAGEVGGLNQVEVNGEAWQAGIQICFEDAFAPHVLDQVNRGADLLINISNDSWSRSSASHWQHFFRSRVRAIETGRMVLRNGNTGVSALVDPFGRTSEILLPYEKGVVRGRLVAPTDRPLYVYLGNWITMVMGLVLGGCGIYVARQSSNKRR